MSNYSERFRIFNYGAIHVPMIRLLLVGCVIIIKSLFENKNFEFY